MKNILKYISALSATAMMAVGCTADFDKVVYDPSNASPAELAGVESSYILEVEQAADVAITFKWSEPDFGYSAAATNNLEFDVEGKEFAGATTLTSINKGGEYAITTKDLNSAIMSLLSRYEMEIGAANFEFRVVSSISDSAAPLYSNVMSSTITPYEGEMIYPSVYIVGDYNGWSFAANQQLYSVDDDGIYSGFLAFGGKSANGWKITGEAGWVDSCNWGPESGDTYTTPEQSPITLIASGGSANITIYQKDYYDFTFDVNTLELTLNASYDTWGVVGQYNGWGEIEDTPFTLSSEVNSAGDTDFFLTATVDLVANEGWKIRPDNAWGSDRGPGSFAGGEPAGADGNFYVEESGQYAIRWYFNKVEQRLEAVKLKSSEPAVMNSLEASYTLAEATAADNALTLSWSAADLATTETITNQVEMDVVGKDFATAYVIGSVEGTSFSTTQEELNVAITNLLNGYSMDIVETEIEFRVYSYSSDSASVPTYSNAVSTKITPYVKELAGDDAANDEGYTGPDNSAYSSIALRGDYNGWDFDQSQKLYAADGETLYSGMIYFNGAAANGWKLCADADWAQNWGLSGGEESEAASWTGSAGGDNISIYSLNSYLFTFDSSTAEFTVSSPCDSWGIVGAYNDWGSGYTDTAMELAYRDGCYYLHATLELTTGSEWKIRPDNTWDNGDINCDAVAVDDSFKTTYGNFTIPEDGVYTIRWYFNSVEQAVRVIKHD
ncbi:MAG: SusE domain-containing protein [Rikenellaceae bacterium]